MVRVQALKFKEQVLAGQMAPIDRFVDLFYSSLKVAVATENVDEPSVLIANKQPCMYVLTDRRTLLHTAVRRFVANGPLYYFDPRLAHATTVSEDFWRLIDNQHTQCTKLVLSSAHQQHVRQLPTPPPKKPVRTLQSVYPELAQADLHATRLRRQLETVKQKEEDDEWEESAQSAFEYQNARDLLNILQTSFNMNLELYATQEECFRQQVMAYRSSLERRPSTQGSPPQQFSQAATQDRFGQQPILYYHEWIRHRMVSLLLNF